MRQQLPTVVVMEACYSSHYWGRKMAKLVHDVKLIPAQHVTPFVRGNKNDHNDAFAISEASQRPYICYFRGQPTSVYLLFQRPANVRISALCRLKLSTSKRFPVCTAFVSASIKTKPR
jgi:hypothetical protein